MSDTPRTDYVDVGVTANTVTAASYMAMREHARAIERENAALHKRVTELETAHAQAMGRAEDLDREAQRYADIANSVNKSWHCRKCGAAIPADMVEQNVEHICEGPDSGTATDCDCGYTDSKCAIDCPTQKGWPDDPLGADLLRDLALFSNELNSLIDGFMNGDPNFTTWDHDVRNRWRAFAQRLAPYLPDWREVNERINGPSTPENNPSHHQRSATINDPANPGIVKGNDGPQF